MEEKRFFEYPTQVVFFDIEEGSGYLQGIAYKDEIICGCCGGVFKINDIFGYAPEEAGYPIVELKGWTDLNYSINGEEYAPAEWGLPYWEEEKKDFYSGN